MDSRVCILCLKLEAIFMHGLKKKPLLNSPTSQSSILSGTLQLNSIINLKQKTGNLISQFFDETKPNGSLSNLNSQSLAQQDDLSFWPFIKNLMNKFDIERYELLNLIKTNTGRQRSWLRSCLNEHCLERFTIAVLANESLTNQYYEEWAFLLDKSYNSTLPMLISGLESILFAINIDNPNLNIPSKLTYIKQASPEHNSSLNDDENDLKTSIIPTSYPNTNSSLNETSAIRIKKPLNNSQNTNFTNLGGRRIKKNNVVVLDNEDKTVDAPLTLEINHNKFNNVSCVSPNMGVQNRTSILANPINYISKKDESKLEEKSSLKKSSGSQIFDGETMSLKSEDLNKPHFEISTSSTSLKDSNECSKPNEIIDISTDSSTENDIYKFDSASNLIPLTPSFLVTTTVDSISINSYQSENSNEMNFTNQSYRTNNLNTITNCYNAQAFNNSPNSLTSSKSFNLNIDTSLRSATVIGSNEYDGLSLKEMRDFVLTMIQRKEELEAKLKGIDANYKEELQKSKDISDKLGAFEQDTKIKNENYENKIQNLESENRLLKDQLKKYVSAVQMICSNTIASSSADITEVRSSSMAAAIPAINPNLQRDYSYEAEEYEKKLIQVAEMHGELMEFNSRLHKILNFKTLQIEKLKQELTELRGPLPNELANETVDETFSMISDIESISNLNSPLINIWIPSAFLRSSKSESHHVYQIYIRIRDEEWNIYRRFSHFYNLNIKLKEKYPLLNTIKFPKKKAIGNKDSKFVENRRKMLQDYLRQIVTKVSQLDRDLNLKPCRETLSKIIPFLSDSYFFASGNTIDRGSIISNVQCFNNPAFGNSLGHIVRNNTFLEANETFSNSPINNLLNTNNGNEPLYTGL